MFTSGLEILLFFRDIHSPALNIFFESITLFGEELFIISVIALFYWCISKEKGIIMGIIFQSSMIINDILKILFHIPRPFEYTSEVSPIRQHTATGYSFPSGHTQGTTTIFILLALVIRKIWFTILAATIIILVGISRLYLNVHWPLDVIASWIIGIAFTLIMWHFFNKLFTDNKQMFNKILITILLSALILAIVMILIKYFIYAELKISNMMSLCGVTSGTITGYLIEQKFLRFKISFSSKFILISRYLLGIILAFILIQTLKILFSMIGDYHILRLIRYFISGLFITYIYPQIGSYFNLFTKGIPNEK